jgi:hypothetical protein
LRLLTLSAALAGSLWVPLTPSVVAQSPPVRVPSARLIAATPIQLPSVADSNSPAVWERIDGRLRLFVFTSEDGRTIRYTGPEVSRLSDAGLVHIDDHPGHGVWFEAIVPDVDGTWYGFYHNEWPARTCDDYQRTIPRIGAARSHDHGATWQNLGVVLASSPQSADCASANKYFVGGVGDFSVIPDQSHQYLYFFLSQYASQDTRQGVTVARLAWADRDAPSGKALVWRRDQTWLPVHTIHQASGPRYVFPSGTPIYRATDGWHDGPTVDAFWGPSVHWNTYLQQYVMLLNRARDAEWTPEGIYVAFSPTLNEPVSWSTPQRVLAGGLWYPQVVGLELGTGTDRLAGERARFFVAGRSDHFIQFSR